MLILRNSRFRGAMESEKFSSTSFEVFRDLARLYDALNAHRNILEQGIAKEASGLARAVRRLRYLFQTYDLFLDELSSLIARRTSH